MREWDPVGPILDVSGVAVDAAGDVVLSDTAGSSVQVFSPTGKLLAHWGSTGTAPGQFRSPEGVAIDAAGTVYVADPQSHRVQEFSLSG